MSHHYSHLTWGRIHVKTPVQHCLACALEVSEMTGAAILILQTPHQVQVDHVVFFARLKG